MYEAAQKGHYWQLKNQKRLDLTIYLWTASNILIFSSKHKFWFPKRIWSRITELSDGGNDRNSSSLIVVYGGKKGKSVMCLHLSNCRRKMSHQLHAGSLLNGD